MRNPNSIFRQLLCFGAVICSIVVSTFTWANPPESALDMKHDKVKAVAKAQREVTADLMRVQDILGTAVGVDDTDEPTLVVYVDQDGKDAAEIVRSLPANLRGAAVRVELTEKFRAFGGKPRPGSGVSHTAKQTPPIQLGTSGGWRLPRSSPVLQRSALSVVATAYIFASSLTNAVAVSVTRRMLPSLAIRSVR